MLCAIPGVGPKMAEKIIEFRKTHGPLKKEADLLKISGIGKKKSKNILKCIKFD
jgi:competence protein ComEA